jgi:hypothetical protein
MALAILPGRGTFHVDLDNEPCPSCEEPLARKHELAGPLKDKPVKRFRCPSCRCELIICVFPDPYCGTPSAIITRLPKLIQE